MINRIVLSGGGTGGHIYPALAIYRRLKELNPDLQCLYIGTSRGLEAEIVSKIEGIEFQTIEISGLKRSLSLSNFKVLWQMLSSTRLARKMIKSYQPEIVVGTGGYVCAPVLYAATKENIPTLIHEQNSVAGITNKFLSSKVSKIATSFKEVHKDFAKFPEKLIYTGNPRGQEVVSYPNNQYILSQNYQLEDSKPTVLIFGGSRGAPAINQAAMESLDYFEDKEYQVIICTGSAHYHDWQEDFTQQGSNLPDNIRVVPYINDMPALFQSIDLVVSRSGATTLAELTALGLPSILVPSPYVTNNHQEHNAMALVHQNAASIIREVELSSQTLTYEIDYLMENPEILETMANNAKKFGTPHAIDDIIEVMIDLT